jgi:hypothetical protein
MWAIARMTVADGPVYTHPPMSLRHALATTAAVIVLAPASASAQGAGDDQYSDPFGDESQQTATPTPAPRRPAATATPAPAQPAQPAQTATPAPAQPGPTPAPAQPGPTAAPGPTLPYTGIDAWPLALGGVLLLGTGLALRARIAGEPD